MPKRPDAAKIFGSVLKKERASRGISQAALAELTGLDRTYVSLLERGIRQPTLRSMIDIAGALDIGLTALVRAIEEEL